MNLRSITAIAMIFVGSITAAQAAYCPDGTSVAGSTCKLMPDGHYVSGDEQPQLAPDGSYTSGQPRIAPSGSYVGGQGQTTLCPDGSYVVGQCHLNPDGTYSGG